MDFGRIPLFGFYSRRHDDPPRSHFIPASTTDNNGKEADAAQNNNVSGCREEGL